MKHILGFAAILAVLFSGIPAFALASTVSGTTTTSASVSTSSTDVGGWQRYENWLAGTTDIGQKVAALPTQIVQTIPIPVLFGVDKTDISPNFGDPRPNGRTHEGEDIMAVKGTPIVSPTPAVVMQIGTGASSGNYVSTINPGGEIFVYMHLDHFAEGLVQGQALKTGDLIGYVGNTGDAAGGPSHLHLEIHDNGVPTDPYPRLGNAFPSADRMTYLSAILTQTSDPTALSSFLVTNFRSEFTAAQSDNVALPSSVLSALQTIPATATVATVASTASLPAGDLELGSRGSLVTDLQSFLIKDAVGPAAAALAKAGATGSFGPMTEAALIEYQTKEGISPADGYYGPVTRAEVLAESTATTAPSHVIASDAALSLTRNLSLGMTGDDVRALQKMLNADGFTVSQSGAGSPGNESTYFGPATKAAVARFQTSKGIAPAAGFVGTLTRGALALL